VSEPVWLPVEDVIHANARLVFETGEPFHVRDVGLLESAVAKPHMSREQSSGSFPGDKSPAVCSVSEVLSPLA
jgi:hypothetical protein